MGFQSTKQDQKRKAAAKAARGNKPGKQVKGSDDNEKTKKVVSQKEFEAGRGKGKKLPTMEEILKKQREKKKKKISSFVRPKRGRDEILASRLGNRRA